MAIFQKPDNDNIANSIPGPISILWLMKYLIATSQLSRTVSQRAEKTGRTKYFEKAYIQTFSHNSLNFRWGAATCQTERLHLFYCINGDWMYFNLHVDITRKSQLSPTMSRRPEYSSKMSNSIKNITLYRKRPNIWKAAKSYVVSSVVLIKILKRLNHSTKEWLQR